MTKGSRNDTVIYENFGEYWKKMEQLLSVEAISTMAEVESAPFKPGVSKLGTDKIKYLNIDVLHEDSAIPSFGFCNPKLTSVHCHSNICVETIRHVGTRSK